MNKLVESLVKDLSSLNEIDAILLAGSHGSNTYDENSDYDLYVYSNSQVPLEKRIKITDKYFKYIEVANTFWEEEDDGLLIDNTPVEIIYRSIDFIENSLKRTVIDCEPNVGYSTCFWSNIINSIVLYDKNNKLTQIKERFNIPYPKELRDNIIDTNYKLLKSKSPAYYYQIEKAIKRKDYISVNHRVAALLASYFDIIFAYNNFLHPGEKKTIKIIKDNNLIVPKNMEDNILNILNYAGTNNSNLLNEIDILINNLDCILNNKQYN